VNRNLKIPPHEARNILRPVDTLFRSAEISLPEITLVDARYSYLLLEKLGFTSIAGAISVIPPYTGSITLSQLENLHEDRKPIAGPYVMGDVFNRDFEEGWQRNGVMLYVPKDN
jgi:hypothetical protein